MAENKILEELRSKLTDSLEENNKFLRGEAERFAEAGNREGVDAATQLLIEIMPQAQKDRHKRNAKIKQRFFFIVRLLKHYGSSICMKRANISQKVFHFCMLLPHCQNGTDMIRYWAWKN